LRPSIENNDSLRLQFDDNTRRRSNLLRKLLLSFPPSASDCRKTEILNTEGETIRSLLERDHQRLDQLLDRASGDLDNIDMEAFGEFRRELLKHIGMEEKILLPAIQQLRGGEPLPIAARLRLDHGSRFLGTTLTFNGDVIAPGQHISTSGTTWFTVGLFYERRITP
jgi:hypothetical protein